MNAWLIVETLIAVAIAGAWMFKRSLGNRFPAILDSLAATLLVVCFGQWISEGAGFLTIGLSLVGIGCSVVGLARYLRSGQRAP